MKAYSDIAILSELHKRAGLSGPDILEVFKRKYGIEISPGTVYPIIHRMEKEKLIYALPHKKKKMYVLTSLGKDFLQTFQDNLEELQGFIICLVSKQD